jgi:TRAP-type C4-dicarboxylate transport system substrate-binding protein
MSGSHFPGGSRVAAVTLTALLLGGCAAAHPGRADKAGGSRAPVELRLAAQVAADDQVTAPVIEYFARAVRRISHDAVTVDITYDATGDRAAYPEQTIARWVGNGTYDLAIIGSRAWDELGVTSMRGFQAPFLIDSYRLLDRVAASPLAAQSLAGLGRAGVVGLALLPETLRQPFGTRPFVTLADYAGARVRDMPSSTSDSLFRALGATPVHPRFDQINNEVGQGRIDMAEGGFASHPLLNTFTANVIFFPKLNTIAINARALNRLPGTARAALRAAASATLEHVLVKPPSQREVIANWCGHNTGRVVTATAAQLATLRRAGAPVIAALDRDAQTASLIAAIARLKATTAPDPPAPVPRGCSAFARAAPQRGAPAGPAPADHRLDGTYRWVLTKSDARRFGPRGEAANGYPQVFTERFAGGRWSGGSDRGTYRIHGDVLVYDWPAVNSVLRFRFTRAADGTLRLRKAGTMNDGDRFVFTSEPWRRVGP